MRYASAALPVPRVTETGTVFDQFYAISEAGARRVHRPPQRGAASPRLDDELPLRRMCAQA